MEKITLKKGRKTRELTKGIVTKKIIKKEKKKKTMTLMIHSFVKKPLKFIAAIYS